MYVRQARNRDEAWLLGKFEEFDIEAPGFRSRDYVIAVDTNDGGSDIGFGRIFVRTDAEVCELQHVTAFGDCDTNRVRSQIVENLLEKAREEDFERAYAVGDAPPAEGYGFEPADDAPEGFEREDDETVYVTDVYDALGVKTEEEKLEELAKEFGHEDATTKYSID